MTGDGAGAYAKKPMARAAEDPAAAAGSVPAELVQAALRAADELGRQVGDVPSAAIAAQAGISRSTLYRKMTQCGTNRA